MGMSSRIPTTGPAAKIHHTELKLPVTSIVQPRTVAPIMTAYWKIKLAVPLAVAAHSLPAYSEIKIVRWGLAMYEKNPKKKPTMLSIDKVV